MNYTNLGFATERVKHLCGISDPIDFKIEDETFIEELLEITLGKKDSELHYRVFLVAAMFLARDIDTQAIIEADDVVFSNQKKTIESLLILQNGYDLSNELTVPNGFSASEVLDRIINPSESPIMSILTV